MYIYLCATDLISCSPISGGSEMNQHSCATRGLRSEQPHPCQQQGLCTLHAGPVTMLAAPQAEEIQGPGLMEGCEQG